MQLSHLTRHTRRAYLRGDAAPKFFELAELSQPQTGESGHALLWNSRPQPAPPALDFRPHPTHLLHNQDGTLSAPTGHAFLSWLADQIAGQATKPKNSSSAADDDDLMDFSPDDDFDPHLDFELNEQPLLHDDDPDQSLHLELEAGYFHHDDGLDLAHLSSQLVRGRLHPQVEITPDGKRLELFAAGSKVVKDVLGRVIEIHSQYGDCLYLRYGQLGTIESFERTDSVGRTHSEGARDKDGVVVRDHEGRVRAAGESMTIDPHGCFFLHGIDGQYYSLDLVTGIHSERRVVSDHPGTARVVTSLFTHDGFRMATMFGPRYRLGDTARSAECTAPRFRFYGRDGSVIEFASDDDLTELQPERVSAPASRAVHKDWLSKRQAATAWQSVHEYLMRVS